MVETAQSVVITAQRDLNNCAAAQARSLQGTLLLSPKQIVKVKLRFSFQKTKNDLRDLSIDDRDKLRIVDTGISTNLSYWLSKNF